MIPFRGRGILLDIEGTTSSVQFVYEVLFPLAWRNAASFLEKNWGDPAVVRARELIARDAGASSFTAWTASATSPDGARTQLLAEVKRLMDADVKATGLKELQGLIWRESYRSGQLKAHVFPEVPAALEAWHAAGLDLRIFSSGSVEAQKLFFAHTEWGDLTRYFRGYYDTTTGPKKQAESYRTIVRAMELSPAAVLFVSDVTAELDAARNAGLLTALAVRPGNAAQPADPKHPVIESFDQIAIF
jgi:enolase-phosphatase E1